MFAGSHPINLKTLKLLTTEIINICTKKLSEMAAHKKGILIEVVVPEKHFFFAVYCV